MNEPVRDLTAMRPHAPSARSKSVVQKGLVITGEIKGDGDLSIEGELEGNVSIQGTCAVAESGIVRGNITAESVHVAGSLTGNATASRMVEIQSTGRVSGDIAVPNISIADGASVNGRVTVGMERKR